MSKTSNVVAEDPLHDLEIAEAMVDELEAYLVSDDLYRTVLTRTEQGDELGGGNADVADHRDHDRSLDQGGDGCAEEGDQGGVDLFVPASLETSQT